MSDWFIERFYNYDDRPAILAKGKDFTYRQLSEKIEALAGVFSSKGIKPGDSVFLEADYSLEGIAALFALFHLRAIAIPVSGLSKAEITERASEVHPDYSIRILDEQIEIQPSETQVAPHRLVQSLIESQCAGLILFSSGSTGKPKAMIHNATRLLETFEKKRRRNHRILIFLLFDHIGGINTLFNGLASGAVLIIPDSRAPEKIAQLIERAQVNLLPASPTFLNLLLLSGAIGKYDLGSLRYITYGTEPMPESLLARLKTAFPQTAFIQTFGTSETGITQTSSRSSSSTQIRIDDPNTEHKVVDGQLWLRSKTQILGYLNHHMDQFTEDGWFRTGDIVELGSEGYLTIRGRGTELINVGGEKVTPSEVESVLLQIPEVADCSVYAESNTITGQNVAARIVATSTSDLKQLKRIIKQHCRKQLSPYKVPARITFVDKTEFSERFKKIR